MMTSLNRLTVSSTTSNITSGNNPMGMSTTATTTTTTTGKKKFGKNLNKLTKPPEPPAASENSKANAASRNGLLLLSTNKRNSGSGTTNGLLASKPSVSAPLPSLGLQYESSTSTHDVLLGAVVGAAASRAEQTPDAWGVAAAANNNNNSLSNGLGTEFEAKTEPKPVEKPVEKPSLPPEPPVESPRVMAPTREESVLPSSNWDEYGGRDSTSSSRGLVDIDRPPTIISSESNHDDNGHMDNQQAYMAKLARERAERRRQEEAARIRDQKEKAAQRLRDLESKLGGSNHSNSKRGVVLEPLGGVNNAPAPNVSSRPTTQRTLYDPNQPNRTYSSLVGGGGANRGDDGKNLSSSNVSGGASIGSSKSGGLGGDISPGPAATPGAYSGPVIQLNSYEDRDRGEAPRAAAPRMLFDPKSGSMVAVPNRDENPRGGKTSSSKGRGRGRGGKQTDEENINSRSNKQAKAKNSKKGGAKSGGKSAKASKPAVASERKLPRTRGVLFAFDEKGNAYCVDECEGDLGYGAHSVPGGRIRNPDAYAKHLEEQQQLYKEQAPPVNGQHHRTFSSEHYDAYDNQYHDPYHSADDYGTGLHTGYSMSGNSVASEPEETPPQLPPMDWVKPNEKIELVTGVDDESPTLQATAREFAPSQAALAAAAQAAALPSLGSQDMDEEDKDSDAGLGTSLEPRTDTPILLNVNLSEEEEDDEDDVPTFMGLGFDPTENMDSVIQSPSAKLDNTPGKSKQLDGVDFASLSLEPPLCGIAANKNHNHIFAFGSSATWGSGNDSNDWGAPMLGGSSNAGTISASRLFGGVLGATSVTTDAGSSPLADDNEDDAFLSLTTGIPGFLGTEDGSITGENMVGGD